MIINGLETFNKVPNVSLNTVVWACVYAFVCLWLCVCVCLCVCPKALVSECVHLCVRVCDRERMVVRAAEMRAGPLGDV